MLGLLLFTRHQQPWHWVFALRWRHNGRDRVSNHQPHYCLLNRLFKRRSKKTSKLRVTGHCVRNSPGTGEFPAQMASNAENVSIWWRHRGLWCIPMWVGRCILTHMFFTGRKPNDILLSNCATVGPISYRRIRSSILNSMHIVTTYLSAEYISITVHLTLMNIWAPQPRAWHL